MRGILQFVRALTGSAMFCCGVAFAAVLFSIYAWLPLPPLPAVVMFSLLAAGAAAAFVAGAVLVRHHLVFWRLRVQPQIKVTLPRGYWVAAVAALVVITGCSTGSEEQRDTADGQVSRIELPASADTSQKSSPQSTDSLRDDFVEHGLVG